MIKVKSKIVSFSLYQIIASGGNVASRSQNASLCFFLKQEEKMSSSSCLAMSHQMITDYIYISSVVSLAQLSPEPQVSTNVC